MAQAVEFEDFEVEGDFEGTKPMEGGSFDLPAEGSYIVDVINLKQAESSTNKPMITVEFKICDEQDTDDAKKYAGQHLWQNYFLTEKALGRLVQLMKAAGAPLEKFRASAILGARMRVDVVHNQGEARKNAEGQELPARVFANVCKERPLEENVPAAPPPPVTKAAAPAAKSAAGKPVTTTAAAKPAGNNAQPRRA